MATKLPIPERLCSTSMLVPHDPATNEALASAKVDRGLKPNGLTIDVMRENQDFYETKDTLDRAGVAAKESGKLAGDVKKVVRAFKAAQTDRNKPKFI